MPTGTSLRRKPSIVDSDTKIIPNKSHLSTYEKICHVVEFSAWSLAYIFISANFALVHFVRVTCRYYSLDRRLKKAWERVGFGSSKGGPFFARMQYPGHFGTHVSTNASQAEQVLGRVKRGIRLKMDKVLDAYLTGGDSDFPSCDSPIWIFGRSYSVNYGKQTI